MRETRMARWLRSPPRFSGWLDRPPHQDHPMSTNPVVLKDITTDHPEGEHHDPIAALKHAIDHAAHLLPAQGPITVFIHHNTLHAFEDMPFEEAVERGAAIFGCRPYLTEERFREILAK